MADVVEINLGGQKFGVRRLTIGQLIDVGAISSIGTDREGKSIEPEGDMPAWLRANADRAFKTIAAALARDFPAINEQAIRDTEMSQEELVAAHRAVLRHAGLIPGEVAGSP